MSKRKRVVQVAPEPDQSRKITSFFLPHKRPRLSETKAEETGVPPQTADSPDESSDDDNFSLGDDGGEDPFDFFSGGVGVEDSQAVVKAQVQASQESTSSVWQWVPLRDVQDIRVLTIEPAGSENETLRCTFRATSLRDPCDYFALSYCWGQTYDDGRHLTHSILCDDHLFKITSNLHEALLRLRKLHSDSAKRASRYKLHIPAIWIDAVCIDQSNPVERSRQIMIMDKIFQNAKHLLVWLGGHRTSEPVILEDEMRSFLSPDPESEVSRISVNQRLRQRAFFNRRWVVQEVFLCGNRHSVMLGDFIFSSSNLKEVLMDPKATKIAHSHIVRSDSSFSKSKKPSLFRNLSRYEDFDCSDDRDKIYALRSISDDGDALPIDYRMPTAKVFLDLAVRWLQAGHLIPTLVCAVTRTTKKRLVGGDALPSWVPNWQIASSDKAIIDFSQRRSRDNGGIRPLRRQDTQTLSDQLYTDARLTDRGEELLSGSCVIEHEDRLDKVRLRLRGWIIDKCTCAQQQNQPSDFDADCSWCFFLPHVKQMLGVNRSYYKFAVQPSDDPAPIMDKPILSVMEHIWQNDHRLFVLENGWILLMSREPDEESTYRLKGIMETQHLVLDEVVWTSTRLGCELPVGETKVGYLR